MDAEPDRSADDERPPICPACGVTMGLQTDRAGRPRFVCLECSYPDD